MTFAWNWFADALRSHPELALFLTLALGQLLGRLRIGPLKLNPVIGALVAGVTVGQIGIQEPKALESLFFLLFLFSVGYNAGPQFFRGLGRSTLSQVGLAVLLCTSGLAATYAISRILGFSPGAAGGLFAGGLSASGALGTANDAIEKLAVGGDVHAALAAGLTVSFAVTYFVGVFTSILVLVRIGPWLMGVDLRSECKKFEEQLGMYKAEEGGLSAYSHFAVRSYKVPEAFAGKSVAELENAFAPERVFVERIRTSRDIIDGSPETRLQPGDLIGLSGRSRILADRSNPLHQYEVDDPELLDIPVVITDHILRRKDLVHRTLGEIAEIVAAEAATRGVFVRKVVRTGTDLPLGSEVTLERGDVITLSGAKRHVERVAARLGPVERPSTAGAIAILGLAIAVGGLIGLPTFRFAGLDIGLSLPVGVLLGGLVAGWLQSVRSLSGRIPKEVVELLNSLGMTGFLAMVAIDAGPAFLAGIRSSGLTLLVCGFLVCAIPHLLTILVGRYFLRMHPGILLGICAGAGTASAAFAALQEAADSKVPTLGFGVSYAVGNVLLALSGSLIVVLMQSPLR